MCHQSLQFSDVIDTRWPTSRNNTTAAYWCISIVQCTASGALHFIAATSLHSKHGQTFVGNKDTMHACRRCQPQRYATVRHTTASHLRRAMRGAPRWGCSGGFRTGPSHPPCTRSEPLPDTPPGEKCTLANHPSSHTHTHTHNLSVLYRRVERA